MAAILVVVAAALVFPFPFEGRLWGEIFNLAHAPVLCGTLLLLCGLLDPSSVGLSDRHAVIIPMTVRNALSVAGVLMTVGILCEYLQQFAGRSTSLSDIAANTVGVTAGLIWILACVRYKQESIWQRLFVPCLLLLMIALPTMLQIYDSVQHIRAFPVIGSFERTHELDGWHPHEAIIRRSTEWSTDGLHSMEVTLLPSPHPGVAILWFKQDWTAYQTLRLDLHNPEDQPLRIVLKINDRRHWNLGYSPDDRFESFIDLPPNDSQTIRLDLKHIRDAPVTRHMDMKHVAMLELFTVNPDRRRRFFVDHIRLEAN